MKIVSRTQREQQSREQALVLTHTELRVIYAPHLGPMSLQQQLGEDHGPAPATESKSCYSQRY